MTTDSPKPDADAAPTAMAILSGSPTPAELAAVTAVLLAAAAEATLSEESLSPAMATETWQRNRHTLRATVTPARGAWRGFAP